MKKEKEIKAKRSDAAGGAVILVDSDEDSGEAFLTGYMTALNWVLGK
ncbi:hypothetical protein LCGC14_1166010 [marine sediment metagenome]|uniref:Uncharacterized protein n=1 Tax=marine sediment metagenome TaxID=412755 RepID=A0A0F9LW45_9ZZZZ